MIILIGGCSCTGKTLMSQKLLEKYKMPCFSLDHLKMGLYRSGINCGFTPTDSDDLIAERLSPIVREMIDTMIENNQSSIIEGYYLLPQYVSELENKYPDKIISVFIGFSADYIKNNFTDGIIKHRNVIERRKYQEERTVAKAIEQHAEIKALCEKYKSNYFEIKDDYNQEISRVYDFIEANIIAW